MWEVSRDNESLLSDLKMIPITFKPVFTKLHGNKEQPSILLKCVHQKLMRYKHSECLLKTNVWHARCPRLDAFSLQNYDSSESKLRREFEVYGPVKRVCTA